MFLFKEEKGVLTSHKKGHGNNVPFFEICSGKMPEKGGMEMVRREKNLWIKALQGSAKAYRKLGVVYLLHGTDKNDRELARMCLEKAMEMGDETGYLIYHRLFSRGKKVIDDSSYEAIWEEYQTVRGMREKQRLEGYLHLGTRKQKQRIFVPEGMKYKKYRR